MQIHQFQQGSKEWLQHRRTHFNASDAPAMMGVSPYKTRTQLLHEIATGFAEEVDEATQQRFDDGHRFEALARPLAENIIGQELYPVTGSEGKYSASFDGLTMFEDEGFEHKSLNDEIRAIMLEVDGTSCANLPLYHRIQMEQQLMVSGADRILFMASKWNGEVMVEERHCWYYPDLDLRQHIIDGWAQFEKDLETYVPAEIVPKTVAEPIMALPALSIQTSGSISIKSNLAIFGEKLNAFVKDLNLKPETDQDFANAEAAVKVLQNAQDALEAAEASALAQASDVDAMRRTVAMYADTARNTRLMLEKLVKAEKENRRVAILTAGRNAYVTHVTAINNEIAPLRIVVAEPDFAASIKGLKTMTSIQDKVDTCLASGKIAADAAAKEIRTKLSWYQEAAKDHTFLFADLQLVIQKPQDDFQLAVKSRIEEHKRAEEVKRIAAEQDARNQEAAKAEEEAKRLTASTIEPAAIAPASTISNISQPSPAVDLQAAVVSQLDVISSFFKTRRFTQKQENEYRAVLVEFIKHQEASKLKVAA